MLSSIDASEFKLIGEVWRLSEVRSLRGGNDYSEITGPRTQAIELAGALAQQLLSQGAGALVRGLNGGA
jgi:hypothetical protein